MALSPISSCSSERTLSPQLDNPSPKLKKSKTIAVESQEIIVSTQSSSSSLPRKRNKSPGVRVVGGRIFDSENGKTCHQCRQKTMDFVVVCKSPRDNKPCTMKFCHKCLLNRYGEKAAEVDQLDDWKCPKCRGICNCSHCMKKRGYQPIGSLLYTAKATGFRSVLEMLTVNGPDTIVASLKKENSCDGKDDTFPHPKYLTSPSGSKKINEYKWIKLEDCFTDDNVVEESKGNDTQLKEAIERCPFSSEISMNATGNGEEKINETDNGCQEERKIRKKNWKKLARAKSNGNACEGIREECAPSEKIPETLDAGTHQDTIESS